LSQYYFVITFFYFEVFLEQRPCLAWRVITKKNLLFCSEKFGSSRNLGKEQLGGASADAQSYWQGRFAACALLSSSFE
jgi:hypothetical protein